MQVCQKIQSRKIICAAVLAAFFLLVPPSPAFSKDKSPYKTHFGAHLTSGGKKSEIHSRAGYYIHIEPAGKSMFAGGAYMPPSSWINAIREEIHYNGKILKKIIDGKEFKKYFGEIEGEKLARPPKGYQANDADIELLKYKSLLAVHKVSDKEVIVKGFLPHIVRVSKVLYPFNEFLNQAID